tara:strand:- start:385 stop:651 length:267 start_codon:yes stop_codon:yes gene_type:complete
LVVIIICVLATDVTVNNGPPTLTPPTLGLLNIKLPPTVAGVTLLLDGLKNTKSLAAALWAAAHDTVTRGLPAFVVILLIPTEVGSVAL